MATAIDWARMDDPEMEVSLDKAAAAVRGEFAKGTDWTDRAVEHSARLTYRAAYVDKVLALTNKDKGLLTRHDYAMKVFGPDRFDSTKAARSDTTVTLHRRLGRAIYVGGVEPGTELWQALVTRGNNREIAALLDSEEIDKGAVEALAIKARVEKNEAAKPRATGDEKNEAEPEKVAATSRDAFAVLFDLIPTADETGLRTMANTCTTLLDAVQTEMKRRATAAAKVPAKATA